MLIFLGNEVKHVSCCSMGGSTSIPVAIRPGQWWWGKHATRLAATQLLASMSCMLRKQKSELQTGGLMDIARNSMYKHIPKLLFSVYTYAYNKIHMHMYIPTSSKSSIYVLNIVHSPVITSVQRMFGTLWSHFHIHLGGVPSWQRLFVGMVRTSILWKHNVKKQWFVHGRGI